VTMNVEKLKKVAINLLRLGRPIYKREEMVKRNMDYINEIISFVGCEYELIKNAADDVYVMKRYEEMLIKGKSEGFTPVIIIPCEVMCRAIEFFYDDENANDRDAIISKSEKIDVSELLKKRIQDAMPTDEDINDDIEGEYKKVSSAKAFASLLDYGTNRIYETLILAKIPTCNPWEVAAWIPTMAGGNECPFPAEHVAVFEYWYKKYGAIPAVVRFDIWELYVERPVRTQEEAVSLAWEQFGYCCDIVYQGVGTVNALAGTVIDSNVWYFWWD